MGNVSVQGFASASLHHGRGIPASSGRRRRFGRPNQGVYRQNWVIVTDHPDEQTVAHLMLAAIVPAWVAIRPDS
jgi:hypothetical protein